VRTTSMAYAAPRHLGYLSGRAKYPGSKIRLRASDSEKALGLIRFQNSLFPTASVRTCARVDATAVVAHFDDHLACPDGRRSNRSFRARVLAAAIALLGVLHSVIDGIPDQVHERPLQGASRMPLSRSVFCPETSSATSFYRTVWRRSRTQPGKSAEELLDRYHANLQARHL